MRKAAIITLDMLTVALLGGAYAMHYFSERKLGMVRWVNYHSQRIQDAVPLDVFKYVVLAVVAVLAIVLVWRVLRTRQRTAADVACALFASAVVMAFAAVVLAVTHKVSHADTFIVVMAGAAALLQVLALALVRASGVD